MTFDFSAEQTSFTVKKLRAVCQGREYLLERTNPFRRERRILALADAIEVARTAPEALQVLEFADGSEYVGQGAHFPRRLATHRRTHIDIVAV